MVAGAAASCGVLNIQNQESAENDRVAPLMICVRSSFDSGAACVRLAGTRPKDFVSLPDGHKPRRCRNVARTQN